MPDTENKPVPRMPTKLGRAGRELWKSIIPRYDLRPDELRILADACRQADVVQRIEDALVDAPLMVKGSQGQLVASPLVSEVRQHRTVLANLLKSLKLPDSSNGDARSKEYTSQKAREAARARWGKPRSA
jgi:hypothetical protein